MDGEYVGTGDPIDVHMTTVVQAGKMEQQEDATHVFLSLFIFILISSYNKAFYLPSFNVYYNNGC